MSATTEPDLTVINVVRVPDGRIVEYRAVPDRFALLAQTGVLARLAETGGDR